MYTVINTINITEYDPKVRAKWKFICWYSSVINQKRKIKNDPKVRAKWKFICWYSSFHLGGNQRCSSF